MVALLSRDAELYSTRVIKNAFEEAGHKVQILDALKLEVKIGKGVFLKGQKITPFYVIPRFSKNILLAGTAVIREWEREGISILNSSRSLTVAHDQLHTLQALSAASLPIPETAFCSQPEGEETLSSLLKAEQNVIKLLDTAQGKGVTLAPDKRTGRSLLTTLSSLHSSGITQQFHPEAEGRDYRLLILKGKVIKAIQRTSKESDFRANVHQGGTVTPYQPSAEEADIAIKATETIGLDFSGVDLIPTDKGCRILEVNASPGLEGVEMGEVGSIARLLPSTMPKQ